MIGGLERGGGKQIKNEDKRSLNLFKEEGEERSRKRRTGFTLTQTQKTHVSNLPIVRFAGGSGKLSLGQAEGNGSQQMSFKVALTGMLDETNTPP